MARAPGGPEVLPREERPWGAQHICLIGSETLANCALSLNKDAAIFLSPTASENLPRLLRYDLQKNSPTQLQGNHQGFLFGLGFVLKRWFHSVSEHLRGEPQFHPHWNSVHLQKGETTLCFGSKMKVVCGQNSRLFNRSTQFEKHQLAP